MISVTILVKNSEETLEKTLKSTVLFPEVIVLDTGSTDQSLSIARKFPNVKIVEAPFQGFGKTHNVATSFTSNDWVLSLDSDEVLSSELVQELLSLDLDETCVYAMLRENFLYGKLIKSCSGWYPDWVVRLYCKKQTSFDDAEVHEKIIIGSLKKKKLKGVMSHVPYRNTSDFLQKMQSYSDLFVKQNSTKKKSSIWQALFHGWAAFLKSYFLKKGVFSGAEGFLISIYNGHVAFYKYLKLAKPELKGSLDKTGKDIC